ncbi:MAG: hypothetical protein NVS9B4_17120 [Candidatus Acidiferrum sp.]
MISQKENLLYRTLLAMFLIALVAGLRVVPHPWNFAPIGATALFSGAVIKDKRLALLIPLAALFAGDILIGFHKLIPFVYVSFVVSVAIGFFLRDGRSIGRIGLAVLLGAIQFFVVTNFAVWLLLDSYPRTGPGLAACYVAGIPYFWNTLAGDLLYSALLFGSFALAERIFPVVGTSARNLACP